MEWMVASSTTCASLQNNSFVFLAEANFLQVKVRDMEDKIADLQADKCN